MLLSAFDNRVQGRIFLLSSRRRREVGTEVHRGSPLHSDGRVNRCGSLRFRLQRSGEDEVDRYAIAKFSLHPIHLLPTCTRICRDHEIRLVHTQGVHGLTSVDTESVADVLG